jgi:nucleoid DNA-binding protein
VERFQLTQSQGGFWIMGKVAVNASKKSPSKSEILANVSESTGVSKKDVSAVLEALGNEIKKAMGSKGPGTFAIPGLVKIEKKKVPARPAKKGVPNPFKPGELMDVAAKPASTKIKVRALKQLKAMA